MIDTSCVSGRIAASRFQPADFEAPFLEYVKHVGNGLVLGGHRDEVPAAVGAVPGGSDDGKVVGLRRTRRPDQLRYAAAKQLRKLLGSPLDVRAAAAPRGMS
jgi:hypothetical protein